MRKRMFGAAMLALLAIFIGVSTKYAVAWRDSAIETTTARPFKRTFDGRSKAPLGVDSQRASQTRSANPLPVVVDGSKHPDRIPDWMAYRHFVSENAIGSDATAQTLARRNAHLDKVGLSPKDRAGLIRVLAGTREKLNDIEQRRKQYRDDSMRSRGGREALRSEEKSVYDYAQQDVLGALSINGVGQLGRHIAEMKKSIVIHGAMPQP